MKQNYLDLKGQIEEAIEKLSTEGAKKKKEKKEGDQKSRGDRDEEKEKEDRGERRNAQQKREVYRDMLRRNLSRYVEFDSEESSSEDLEFILERLNSVMYMPYKPYYPYRSSYIHMYKL